MRAMVVPPGPDESPAAATAGNDRTRPSHGQPRHLPSLAPGHVPDSRPYFFIARPVRSRTQACPGRRSGVEREVRLAPDVEVCLRALGWAGVRAIMDSSVENFAARSVERSDRSAPSMVAGPKCLATLRLRPALPAAPAPHARYLDRVIGARSMERPASLPSAATDDGRARVRRDMVALRVGPRPTRRTGLATSQRTVRRQDFRPRRIALGKRAAGAEVNALTSHTRVSARRCRIVEAGEEPAPIAAGDHHASGCPSDTLESLLQRSRCCHRRRVPAVRHRVDPFG